MLWPSSASQSAITGDTITMYVWEALSFYCPSHLISSFHCQQAVTILCRDAVGLGACLENYNCHSGEHNRTLLYLMSSRTGQDRTYQKEDVGISLRALGGRFKHHRLHYCLPMDREWSCSPQATSSSTTLHTHAGDECK